MMRRLARVGAVASVGLLAVACMGDKGVAPSIRTPAATLGAVRVSPLNAVMAVGDTMMLRVTGQSLSGAPLTDFDSVTYVLQNISDTLRVQLSPIGVVTARASSGANNPVFIEVVGFKDGLARADQAIVQVTTTALVSPTLSIQPSPGDSTILAIGNDKYMPPTIASSVTGDVVDGPMIRFEYGPGDSTIMQCYTPDFSSTPILTGGQLAASACGGANVSLNTIHGNIKGTAWIVAEMWVYGAILRDSVQYTLTNSLIQYLGIGPTNLGLQGPSANSYLIRPGGVIAFYNTFATAFGATVDWVFDNPSGATESPDPSSSDGGTSGNITPLTPGHIAYRQFLTPGTYHWTATVTGGIPPFTGATTTGDVIVQ